MPGFAELLQQGAGSAWLFIPSAIVLGALHGLEPGHSKTLMAAFIIAVRGTVAQAVLLGIAATISHTAIVWLVAIGGMYLWQGMAPEAFEPWFQLLSGLIIIGMAVWMLWRTQADRTRARMAGAHSHDHDHHDHHDVRRIDTGHGVVSLEIHEEGVPPRWRLRTLSGQHWHAEDVAVTIERPDGRHEHFAFEAREGFLESRGTIAEPHAFMARVSLGHAGHSHDYDLSYVEPDSAAHDHMHEQARGLDLATDGYQDAHALAHANDIRRRFADRNVTTWQIVVFGLTAGLIPCPAAITVLLLCLQLEEIALGATLVLAFSLGLAAMLVAVGAVAALSVRHAIGRSRWFATLADRAPYLSGGIIIVVGLYVAILGAQALWR
jgi:nickel/cobalt exporter